jgi:hypothetical protein
MYLMALLLGTGHTNLSRMERRKAHNAYTFGFYVVAEHAPDEVIKSLLFFCSFFRRPKPLNEKESRALSDFARLRLTDEEYSRWSVMFNKRLKEKVKS